MSTPTGVPCISQSVTREHPFRCGTAHLELASQALRQAGGNTGSGQAVDPGGYVYVSGFAGEGRSISTGFCSVSITFDVCAHIFPACCFSGDEIIFLISYLVIDTAQSIDFFCIGCRIAYRIGLFPYRAMRGGALVAADHDCLLQ